MSEQVRVRAREPDPRRCTFCLEDIPRGELWRCEGCGAGQHPDCRVESLGCGVVGCHVGAHARRVERYSPLIRTFASVGYSCAGLVFVIFALIALSLLGKGLSDAGQAWTHGHKLEAIARAIGAAAVFALSAGLAWGTWNLYLRCSEILGLDDEPAD